MSDLQTIVAQFDRANVPIAVSPEPLNRAVRDGHRIVQMDIDRARGRRERIRIYVPDDDAVDVRVLGIDRDLRQVVVMVKEAERTFVERVWDRLQRKNVDVVRKSPSERRRFLVGMDEGHLFVAQLTSQATTVRQAHEGLRPSAVPTGRAARRQKVVRQGEWFFVPANEDEARRVEDHVRAYGVVRDVGIGGPSRGRGRPHVVSESVMLRHVPKDPTSATTEYVRGRVLHPDHKVVHLAAWHRVRMNTEDRTVNAQWVD